MKNALLTLVFTAALVLGFLFYKNTNNFSGTPQGAPGLSPQQVAKLDTSDQQRITIKILPQHQQLLANSQVSPGDFSVHLFKGTTSLHLTPIAATATKDSMQIDIKLLKEVANLYSWIRVSKDAPKGRFATITVPVEKLFSNAPDAQLYFVNYTPYAPTKGAHSTSASKDGKINLELTVPAAARALIKPANRYALNVVQSVTKNGTGQHYRNSMIFGTPISGADLVKQSPFKISIPLEIPPNSGADESTLYRFSLYECTDSETILLCGANADRIPERHFKWIIIEPNLVRENTLNPGQTYKMLLVPTMGSSTTLLDAISGK